MHVQIDTKQFLSIKVHVPNATKEFLSMNMHVRIGAKELLSTDLHVRTTTQYPLYAKLPYGKYRKDCVTAYLLVIIPLHIFTTFKPLIGTTL